MDRNVTDKRSNNLVSLMVCVTSKYFGKFIAFCPYFVVTCSVVAKLITMSALLIAVTVYCYANTCETAKPEGFVARVIE